MQTPIGVFDSGLGGLTILQGLRERLPHESFIYLGDVAKLPYGNKSAAVINTYSQRCVEFLKTKEVKCVVVACNTATALSLPFLLERVDMPIVGVIQGGVQAAIQSTQSKRILVLATDSTVRNEAYLREFNAQGFQGEVRQIACPLLVALAEEGWWDHRITSEIISHYLSQETIRGFEYDTVVLGCTHYPLLIPSFRQVLSPSIQLVHGSDAVAEQVESLLQRLGKLSGRRLEKPFIQYFATDHVSPQLPLLKLSSVLGKIQFQGVTLE